MGERSGPMPPGGETGAEPSGSVPCRDCRTGDQRRAGQRAATARPRGMLRPSGPFAGTRIVRLPSRLAACGGAEARLVKNRGGRGLTAAYARIPSPFLPQQEGTSPPAMRDNVLVRYDAGTRLPTPKSPIGECRSLAVDIRPDWGRHGAGGDKAGFDLLPDPGLFEPGRRAAATACGMRKAARASMTSDSGPGGGQDPRRQRATAAIFARRRRTRE